ncbi:MAG: cobalamin-dependent protein, partial [Methylococcales bacterium]|nr:cobalamin-dependent protein [Methylococcales bacterium]
MRRYKIVLYNPRAVFWTMPLALLAVGSALDRDKYEVVIVDGRIDPPEKLHHELQDALCLGVTVLTGAPLHDALAVTRTARAKFPELPIVWGGWHPSLFPEMCAAEPGVTAVVTGQGEETFAEIIECLLAGESLKNVLGCGYKDGNGRVVLNFPRVMRNINHFPQQDYSLIPVEQYFKLKGQRQLDYISSQGCRFRCNFCADPAVF